MSPIIPEAERPIERCKICGEAVPCTNEIDNFLLDENDALCRHGILYPSDCDRCKDEEAEGFV